eukprot:270586-Pleurochrysis_carterae.AAC.1
MCADNCSSLRHASLLSCARADAFHRMFTAVAKLFLFSASACLAIALVHTYWIHGSRLLRIAESSNPMLVSHISRLDFGPSCHCVADAMKLCLVSTPTLLVGIVRFVEKMDEQLNDAAVDFVFDLPSMLGAGLCRAWSPTCVNQTMSSRPPPRSTRISAPIASCSHALIASSARRNAAR